MRILLTSDWQTEFANLDLCEQALVELIAAGKKHKPDAIIHAGDLKDAYNPVDIRVAKFWVRAIKQIKDAGFRFIILLGNHDRISQSLESKNWLDILRAAGAETVTQPKAKPIGNGYVWFLPYTADKKQAVEWAKTLSEDAGHALCPTALVFHLDVKGARMGAIESADGLTVDQLNGEADYGLCIGGHFHEHQFVERNTWFVGSPFCHDWGEANQPKGFVLARIGEHKGLAGTVEHIRTSIPGWYDLDYIQREGIKPEPGAYIRSKIPVTSKKITDELREAEKQILQKYGNVRAFVIPLLQTQDEQEIRLDGVTDKETITQYVSVTYPEGARFTPEQAITYLVNRLSTIAPGVSKGGFRFDYVEAENVLVFEKIRIDYRKQGLVLLRGINQDWPGRSNGCGKTSALSLLTIALSGETLKKQRHDQWASEFTDKPAKIRLGGQNARKQKVDIERRRPHALQLWIDGKDQSSGITGKGDAQTQGLINQTTGYDLRMLLNSVYIDQTIANGFVFGTNKDRMDLVAKIQDLKRYETALELVKSDITKNERQQTEETGYLERWEEEFNRLTEELQEASSQIETDWAGKLQTATKEVNDLVKEHASLTGVQARYEEMQREVDDLETDRRSLETRIRDIRAWQISREDSLRKAERLIKNGCCPECGQEAKKVGLSVQQKATEDLADLKKKRASSEESLHALVEKIADLGTKLTKYDHAVADCEQALCNARVQLQHIQQAAKEEAYRNAKIEAKKKSIQKELLTAKRFLRACREAVKTYSIDRELLEYAKKSFSRTGMPLYLCAALCPVLNNAADYYSELFNDGKLKIRFSVKDGEFCADVINPAGSQTVEGQSVGESAMAGVVCAFALREVAPKSNLLILDEPGHGLDSEGAKQFANGLLKLKSKFETILVTTHSQVIESVLSGEKIWTVTKKNGVSSLST